MDIKRQLLIFIGGAKGKLKCVSRNENVVFCAQCGGVYGDPYHATVIKNGYFTVGHYGGSAWLWSRLVTFRCNKKLKDWFLHRDGGESFHISKPKKIERNTKTQKNFGKVAY